MQFTNHRRVVCSASTITFEFVGQQVAVYNGQLFQNFSVLPAMVGFKFGEFIRTKKLGSAIHQTGKKGKKLPKKK